MQLWLLLACLFRLYDLHTKTLFRLYSVHDEGKSPHFELEISWACAASGFRHVLIPRELFERADAAAKRFIAERDHA